MARQTKAEQEHRLKVSNYEDVFGTEKGQAVLDDLELNFQKRLSFNPDPYVTAYHEGARSVYLRILEIIDEARDNRTGKRRKYINSATGLDDNPLDDDFDDPIDVRA